MNNPKILFSIFLLISSSITCTDKRVIFAENLRKSVQALKKPAGSDNLVSGFQNKLTLLFYTLSRKELDGIQVKYDLSDALMTQIKAAAFARTSGMKQIIEKIEINYYSYEETIGAVLKENDNRVTFALIKTRSFATLKPKYEKYYVEECSGWFIFKHCHDVEKQRERELTYNERLIIGNATIYSAKNSVLEGVNILKKGDYQLYMSDTGSIFSPDKRSVAHVCYFGNIAIGPTSELNSVLPINYGYIFNNNKNNNGHMVKKIEDKVEVLNGYPMYNNQLGENIIAKKGKFHKFNFLNKFQLTRFPGQYIEQMNRLSKMGPFVLEVKKNGNVIYYQKNNPKAIMWQTNTANKGIGPYNFYLTNNKELILEDSTGKILYKYNSYIEIPTIYYGNGYNGFFQKENDFKPINPSSFRISTDNKDFQIKWNIERKGNYNNIFGPKIENKITKFSSHIIGGSKNFDICYAARLCIRGWTSFGCNGEYVGLTLNYTKENYIGNVMTDDIYITNLVIYIKQKNEGAPKINNNSKVVHFNVTKNPSSYT